MNKLLEDDERYKTFRKRLDAANNARLLAFACETPEADINAFLKWREVVATYEDHED